MGIAAGTASALTVTVSPGQSLTGIAAQYGTTVAALAAANGISDPNLIVAGSVLQVPQSPVSVTVEPGDTLSAIAETYGATYLSLASANGLADPNQIYPGEVLTVPAGHGPGAGAGLAPVSVVVAPGDTLTAIAAAYGTSVAALTAANGISNPNAVAVGQTLEVPAAVTGAAAPASAGLAGLPPALLAHPDRLAYLPDFAQAASTYGVPASLLEAVCFWESGWQPTVVSVTGAFGMCQIEPWTAAYIDTVLQPGSNLSVSTAADNIDMGAALLSQLLAATGGDRGQALAGYYQGLASVAQSGLFPSTRAYVTGILALTGVFASA